MVETVDHDNVDDSVEERIFSSLIEWLVDVSISLFIVVSEDETVLDIDICVITVEVKSLLVAIEECVNDSVSDMIVENVDGYIELLTLLIDWTDDVSKFGVIMLELWSEFNEDIAALVVVICVDDTNGKDELSIEIETPLIVAVTNSVSGEEVSSMVGDVVSLLVLEIRFVVVGINWVVDSSDSTDEVWSRCELNTVVNIDVSGEIDSVFNVVTVTVDNSFVYPVEEGVWYDDSSDIDATTVEVPIDNVSEDLSAVVDISDDEDKEEYSVEVASCSLVVVKVLVKNSVDSELVVDTTGI